LARRKERMSELRRRELVRAVEVEKSLAAAASTSAGGAAAAGDGSGLDGAGGGDTEGPGGRDRAMSAANTPGRRKKKGHAGASGGGGGVVGGAGGLPVAAETSSSSTDRAASSSASPARNRSRPPGPPPPSSLLNVKSDEQSTLTAAAHVDDGEFTLVTPHKSSKAKAPATPTTAAALIAIPIDEDDGLASASSDVSAATPSGKKSKKRTKKTKGVVTGSIASSLNKVVTLTVADPTVLEEDQADSTPRMANSAYASSTASSSSFQPGWLATTRPSEASSCETSVSNGPRPSQLPTSSSTPAAEIAVSMAKRELDEARVRHGKEIEDLQREVARYQTLSEEAQRAEEKLRREAAMTRRESAAAQDEMKALRSALDQAREEMAVELSRRETVIAELSPKSAANGDVPRDAGSDDGAAELDQLRRDNARLHDELKRLQAAPVSSPPPRSRDPLQHQELVRLRDDCNKLRKAEGYWRARSEHGERVVQELAASQTDLQRKLAEVSSGVRAPT
jgi:hypothetical protein